MSRALLTAAFLATMLSASPAAAEMPVAMNLSGTPGLIDMPSSHSLRDGWMGLTRSQFGPVSRSSLSYQITPRLSGSFRYVGIRNWNDRFCPTDCSGANAFETYYDRNFDIRYQILNEGRYLPAVTIGLQDFVGTGLAMAEYVVATKSIGPRLRVSAGLGFGRLGSHGAIGSPFGPRPDIDFGEGGLVNSSQWFRGPAAPFGGIEYQVADNWTLKAEYSSDAYAAEAGLRGTFARRTPYNFGVEYSRNANMRIGVYSMYGSEVGVSLSIMLNPDQRPAGGIGGVGPMPITPRANRATNPAVYTTGWVTQPGAKEQLITSLNAKLEREKIVVESLGVTGDLAQVRFRNPVYDASAQAVGRVARAMARALPSSVEIFEIVPVSNGVAAAKVTVRRSDLERLEFAPDAGPQMRARTTIGPAGPPLPNFAPNPELYPKLTWSLGPWAQTVLFNPAEPIQFIFGANLKARYEFAPGLILSGSVTQRLAGGVRTGTGADTSPLPPVRRDGSAYLQSNGPSIETLTASWYGQLAPEFYGHVTVGYLERMFGGISAEVLYQPVNRNWALGADINYVAQRDTDGGFGFGDYDYRVATGHVSGYYDFGNGYQAQLDLGRYLAGDVGGTFTFLRNFENGWKVGAFATVTNVSAEDFGEGSFDKGIKMEIPFSYFTGQATRSIRPFVLRPLGRDGGAKLQVDDRLRETLRGYGRLGLDAQWGRFWK